MPDALSKTVPIWCAIWNALLFPSPDPTTIPLHLPPTTVSASEHAQIASRLPSFLAAARALNLPLDRLRGLVKKPLRPLWVTRDSPLPNDDDDEEEEEGEGTKPAFPDFHPVILCTASRRVPGGEASEGGYVQGAGDDSEGWACGLTAPLWWEHAEALLRASEAELPGVIGELVAAGGQGRGGGVDAAAVVQMAPAGWVWVCAADALREEATKQQFDAVIECGGAPDEALARRLPKGGYLHFKCGTGKLGSRDLRSEVSKIEGFVRRRRLDAATKLAICCQTGKDLSVGVALAVLCLYTDDEGRPTPTTPTPTITKPFIRQRLSWIMTAHPTASPSRATLQSINAFLFSPRAPPPPSTMPPTTTPLSRTFTSLTTKTWSLSRTLTTHLPPSAGGTPSARFAGTATFTPRAPTAEGYAGEELLYAEEGVLAIEKEDGTAMEVPARRRYVWRRYRAGREGEGEGEGEGISIWFVKEDGESVDYLFLDMEVRGVGGQGEGRRLEARGRHPCGEDVYDATFVFGGGEQQGEGMVVTYVVKGPTKDYVSETRYTR
ncbi:tRNA A64-2'-O-ribosylphosphate transferase [Diplodia seriata]|uniref:tRNA A64-2'-O-ribosylphosphate transferase n=1 Tax=Diplodia seriata TaxID=420778 RepID=A0A1S8BP14_9PEZI|nr:tRNA A64-2'-O-ribosylphosphate transferase [Diplodia seriata]